MRDLMQSDELKLTQEFLAQMLGVQRPSVSMTAATLQRSGLITYRRGTIQLLEIERLQESACECYETVKANYRRLLS
jgi:Mn-dependent DtxR family transcriptional regulator